MNVVSNAAKANAIRARLTETPMEPPRVDTWDANKNMELFRDLEKVSAAKKLRTYIIMWGEVPVATIVHRYNNASITVWVTKFVNGRRVMYKNKDYNATDALAGLDIPSVHSYCEQAESPRHFVLKDSGESWEKQLLNNGFKVWRTL